MTRIRRRSWTIDQKHTFIAEIIARTSAGDSFSHVARDLGLHESTLRQWVRKLSPTADVRSRPRVPGLHARQFAFGVP